MKTNLKRRLCLIISLVFLLSAVSFSAAANQTTVSLIHSEGWLETAYVTWNEYSGADGYNVYCKQAGGEYFKLDDELVRTYPGYFRADALGLPEGEYILKVVPVKNGAEITDASAETGALSVMKHAREGFAFSKNSPYGTSSGAYNDDGTLREDADVIYVTNGNKDTVTINGDESLGVGLYNILAYRESKKIKTTLCIRLIGRVDEPALTDNHTVRFINTGNITLEGVGDDALIYGWIITLKRSSNFEMRNFGMMYGGEGTTGSAVVLDTDNKNFWAHNCDFFYGAPGKDADQIKGDGAIDIKSRSDYVTVAYNHMWDLGKTCVSGGPWENSNMYTDEAKIYATYHHNWFDHTDSRHPRCVVGSNHVYNNYYDGNALYGIGAAMKTSVFSENNYYRNCQRPMIIASQGSDCYNSETGTYNDKGTLSGQMGGMIKSYGDVIVGAKRFYTYQNTPDVGEFDAYIANSRDEVVPETVTAKKGDEVGKGTYNNFDTDPSIMYEYSVDTAEEAVEKVKKYAGRVNGGDFKWTFDNAAEDTNHEIIPELLEAIKSYKSKLVAVAGGAVPVEPPYVTPTSEPTKDPDATSAPTAKPPGDITKIPTGVTSYAKDWFGGQSMSAGDISNDGYVGCYKGSGNSYKTNKFTAGDVAITRGYQTKQVDSRSFYCIPESECLVTVYFYSNGSNYLGLYTTDLSTPAATFTPEAGGDCSFTYHFTEVGSPLYIAGPVGDINLAGISVAEAGGNPTESPEPTSTPFEYQINSAEYVNGNLEVEIKYNKTESSENASLIAAEYNKYGILIGFKTADVSGNGKFVINGLQETAENKVVLYIWNSSDNITPLSDSYEVK